MPEPGEIDHEDDRLLHRMLFFSDAVFAIVLTLLALELKPPHARDSVELARALVEMIGHFISFGISFALVAVFWVAHMNTLRRLSRFDWPTAWANLTFLLPVCLLPFASSLLGEAEFGTLAWRYYSWNLVISSLAMLALILVTTRDGGRLVGGLTSRERVYRAVRATSPGVAFAVSLIAVETGQLEIARFSPLLIPVQFLLAELFLKARPAKPAPDPQAPAEA